MFPILTHTTVRLGLLFLFGRFGFWLFLGVGICGFLFGRLCVRALFSRYWLSFEMDEEYIQNSELRFMDHEEAEQRYGHRVEDENTNLSGFDGESPATSN